MLRASARKVALKTDFWSSTVYRGYLSVIAHWIDKTWTLQNFLLSFEVFLTPHTGQEVADVLLEVIEDWGLARSISAITTDNGSDIVKGVELVCLKLRLRQADHTPPLLEFHISFVGHVINL